MGGILAALPFPAMRSLGEPRRAKGSADARIDATSQINVSAGDGSRQSDDSPSKGDAGARLAGLAGLGRLADVTLEHGGESF